MLIFLVLHRRCMQTVWRCRVRNMADTRDLAGSWW